MADDILFEKPSVRLVDAPEYADEIIASGALGCFEEKSSGEIFDELKALPAEERSKKIEGVIAHSAGLGHGSVLDQQHFTYSIENLPRAATLQLCLPEYPEHEQQSLRRAKADRGFYIPPAIRDSEFFESTKKILYDSFDFYEKMMAGGIPGEDARYILPIATKTNIQTCGNVRELQHLQAMNNQGEVPSIVKGVVNEMINIAEKKAPASFKNCGKNYETLAWRPSSQLYSTKNATINRLIEDKRMPKNTVLISYSTFDIKDAQIIKAVRGRDETELSNLKHIHFDFLAPISLAGFHQSTRQRTWNHSVESIYDAAKRGDITVPPSINGSSFLDDYMGINIDMLDICNKLIDNNVPRSEAILVIPHSVRMYDFVHVDGWNAIHSIGKRTCTAAQWEIRGIANEMAKYIKYESPSLGRWAEPQGVVYGKCPEKKSCGLCERKLSSPQYRQFQ